MEKAARSLRPPGFFEGKWWDFGGGKKALSQGAGRAVEARVVLVVAIPR